MKYKFSLICDYELVGYFNDIIGLNADNVVVYNDRKCHKLQLSDFHLCDEYLSYLEKNKSSLNGECTINILDYEGISIGTYTFFIHKEIKYKELSEMKKNINLTVIGVLQNIAIGNEIKLWDKWRVSKPKQKNEWVTLNGEDRIAWLNIVMRYHLSDRRFYNEPYENIIGGTYYLDGKNITTIESFFCALGEAINGPGGYYGFDECNVIDCLTGGFRVCYPHKLIWKSSTVGLKNLSKEEWENKVKRDKEQCLKLFDDSYIHSIPKHSFFCEIVDILLEYHVILELEP